MAERKSVNKYYPPDWDPSKGSVNKYVGQHPLRDRAKKIGQGILVIRFEMPYNIWCGGCNSHIGMGVRYNAEKTKTGKYYSTPIYKFRMKCHLCDNYFEIQTDPKNHDYVILEGARRKEQRWDPKENEQIVPEDKATQKKMATDAMFKLEHGSDDVKRGKQALSNLGSLEIRREEWKDDYMLNKMARQKFREEKKSIKTVEAADIALLKKSSLEIPLMKETDEDVRLAGLIKYKTLESYDEKKALKRQAIETRPLFTTKKSKLDSDSQDTGNNKLDIIRQNVKIAKLGKSKGPFDRMTMNSLSTGPTLNRSSLGIRRKSATFSSISESVSETTGCDQQEVKRLSGDVSSDNHDEGDEVSVELSTTTQSDMLDKTKETLEEDSIDKDSTFIDKTGDKTVMCSEKDNVIENETCDNDKKVDQSTTVKQSTTIEMDKVQVTHSLIKSGLSLVSTYSDSDTDSNSS